MRSIFFIIPAALILQVAGAQNGTVPLTVSQGTYVTVSPATSTPVKTSDPTPSSGSGENIMDYKSVYEAATLEEEVQMAAERFHLTKSQQDVWMTAATDRRQIEKQAYEKLNSKSTDYDKDPVYLGLRISHNTFYETIIGYLNPAQKQAIELDRAIRNEKQKRLAKLPPPAAPTVTVAPVDSAAIKEPEKIKGADKKSKKKKKPAGS